MVQLNYNVKYFSGITAMVHWIAEDEFNGYILEKTLQFFELNNLVVMTTTILDQSLFNGQKKDLKMKGRFEITPQKKLICSFGSIEMKGKVLGKQNEFLTFSTYKEGQSQSKFESFKIR